MTWQEIEKLIQDNITIVEEGDNAFVGLRSKQGSIALPTLERQSDTEAVAMWTVDIIAQMIAEKVVPVVIQQERERIAKTIDESTAKIDTRFRNARQAGNETAVTFALGKREGLLDANDIVEGK